MSDFSTAFPNSRKIHLEGPENVRVPAREIALENGSSSIRVYDTSGPQGHDVKEGLPKLREKWVRDRLGDAAGPNAGRLRDSAGLSAPRSRNVTQLHYARKGE